MSSFFHRIMGSFRGKYFKGLRAITFGFGAGFNGVPRSGDSHKVCKRSSWGKNTVNLLPIEDFFHEIIHLEFHKCETRCKFICIDRAIYSRSHHGTKDGVLIESSKKLIVEMRMVGFGLFVENFVEQG